MTRKLLLRNYVYLLINNDSGKEFCHQYKGVACSHIDLKGKLIDLGISDARVFDPIWWYNHPSRFDNKTGGLFYFNSSPRSKWQKDCNSILTNKRSIILENKIQRGEYGKIFSPVIIKELQKEIDRLTPESIYKIKIELYNPTLLTEALVFVNIFDTKEIYEDILTWHKNIKHGYIIWENCD